MIRSHTGAVERRHLDEHGAARRHRSHVDSDDSRASDLLEGGVVGVKSEYAATNRCMCALEQSGRGRAL